MIGAAPPCLPQLKPTFAEGGLGCYQTQGLIPAAGESSKGPEAAWLDLTSLSHPLMPLPQILAHFPAEQPERGPSLSEPCQVFVTTA